MLLPASSCMATSAEVADGAGAGGGEATSSCESKAVPGVDAVPDVALDVSSVLASLAPVVRAPDAAMVTGLPDSVLPPPWRILVQGNGSPTRLFALLTG